MSLFDSWCRAWLRPAPSDRWSHLEDILRGILGSVDSTNPIWRKFQRLSPDGVDFWDETVRFPSGVSPSNDALFEVRISNVDLIKQAALLGELPFRFTIVGFVGGIIDDSLIDALDILSSRWPECMDKLGEEMRLSRTMIDKNALPGITRRFKNVSPSTLLVEDLTDTSDTSPIDYLFHIIDRSELEVVVGVCAPMTAGSITRMLETTSTLEALELYDCGFDYEEITRIVESVTPQLDSLCIKSDCLTTARADTLVELISQRGLEIANLTFCANNRLDTLQTPATPVDSEPTPPALQTLRVSHPPDTNPNRLARVLQARGPDAFDHIYICNAFLGNGTWEPVLTELSALYGLRGLTLEGLPLGELAEAFFDSAQLTRLEALELDALELTSGGLVALARNEHFGSLQRLILSNTSIDERAARALARADWPALTTLELSNVSFSGRAFELMIERGPLSTLRELRIRWAEIGDEGLCAIADSMLPHSLRVLATDNVGATPAGVRTIARSEGFEDLRALTLSRNAIGDYGLRVLLESTSFTNLQTLELSSCGIRQTSCDKALADAFPSLRELQLADNQLSLSEMARLFNKPLPGIQIVNVEPTLADFAVRALAMMIARGAEDTNPRDLFINGVQYQRAQLLASLKERSNGPTSTVRNFSPPSHRQHIPLDVDAWLELWDVEPSEQAWRAIMQGMRGGLFPLADITRIRIFTSDAISRWPDALRVLSDSTILDYCANINASRLSHLFSIVQIKSTSSATRFVKWPEESSGELSRADLSLELGNTTAHQQSARTLIERTAPVLHELTLTGASFDVLTQLSAPLPMLASLQLERARGVSRARFYRVLADLDAPALEHLTVRDCNVGDDGVRGLEESARRLPKLRLLRLEACQLTHVGATILANVIERFFLTELCLSKNNIDDSGVEALCASPGLHMLKLFELTRCGLGDESARHIAQNLYLNDLTVLDLSANKIGDEGARALGESKMLVQLESLGLADTNLSAAGVDKLMSGYGMRALSTLWLSDNALGRDAMRALTSAPRFSRIQELDVSGNPIDYATALMIVRAAGEKLTRVRLHETLITDDELASLIYNAPSTLEELTIQ